jgi:hypothetical protein
VYGFSHSLTLEAVASHHPKRKIGNRGFIHFDAKGIISSIYRKREFSN